MFVAMANAPSCGRVDLGEPPGHACLHYDTSETLLHPFNPSIDGKDDFRRRTPSLYSGCYEDISRCFSCCGLSQLPTLDNSQQGRITCFVAHFAFQLAFAFQW